MVESTQKNTTPRSQTQSAQTPEEVLAFWLDELEPKDWYNSSDQLDARIFSRFGDLWSRAQAGALSLWLTYPSGTLAYLILTDQMPRNMFRGQAEAFASDRAARTAAKAAIAKGWDKRIDAPARQFFYMPLMHSECQSDQDRCVRLMSERLEGVGNLVHAQVHREIIRKFGRFPYRNDALGRASTDQERAFISDGGYGEMMKLFDKVAA